MNTESFSLSEPDTYDVNVMRINPLCPLAIQTSKLNYKRDGDELILTFDPNKESTIKFYKQFNKLNKDIWNKCDTNLRNKFPKTITDNMYCSPIKHSDNLLDYPTMRIEIPEGSDDDLQGEGIGVFLIALKYVHITPTSAVPKWFIPVGKYKKIVNYNYDDLVGSDNEE